jgi:peptidoglycan hydrolase-like protein with peptidoglycan-binding domain
MAHRSRVRATPLLLVALALTLTVLGPFAPARAENKVTPGDFTGYGFDQCNAPTQSMMNAWLKNSPFWAVGIYISGDSRACREQANLTPLWVKRQLAKGWRLLPISLGPQASCNTRFPRYGSDERINSDPGDHNRYSKARRQARAEAEKTVTAAGKLGIVPGSTLWYDLEGFDVTNTRCRESALAFLSAYTVKIHALDYVSGVYSSAGSGIKMLDDARVDRPNAFTLPDAIWIARWDDVADTSTSYIRSDGWLPGGRMKQYAGGHDETWGGVRINIDRDWLDLGKGSVAPATQHCGGIAVDLPDYPAVASGASANSGVLALQCLLQERGLYSGKLNGNYNTKLLAATQSWQQQHGFAVTQDWRRPNWMSLLADGTRPVLKFGSASDDVRRVQRSLNAARKKYGLSISGSFNTRTVAAVKDWQTRNGLDADGIITASEWKALRTGLR